MAQQKDQIDQDALAAEWGLALNADGEPAAPPAEGQSQDAAAAQWGAAPEEAQFGGSQAKGGGADRILNQDEIDSLLGF
ncbi:MAG: flagellar motor switch protein FliM, partial [Pseudolabrys sp.]|nr:flagellar motor switch protein FliM [Pseudolabrys sp.]